MESVSIQKNRLKCKQPGCSFQVEYACPVCDSELTESCFSGENQTEIFQCSHCKNVLPVQKIQYIVENGLHVDSTVRCTYCNGPTLHRQDMNIGNRCLFYPKCSGEVGLFGVVRDSLVFLDFETTGLDVGKDALIEVGAVKIDEEGFEHTFQTFINPNAPVNEHITKITGITTEMVQNAPSLAAVMQQLLTFIGGSKVVAHNADFDIMWLVSSFIKLEMSVPQNQVICTLKWARAMSEPHCSLGALTKKYKVGHRNAHRALADAIATKELFLIFEGLKKAAYPALKLDDYVEVSRKIVQKAQEQRAFQKA